jgi:hypothetical protein
MQRPERNGLKNKKIESTGKKLCLASHVLS